MAKITFNNLASDLKEPVRFVFGNSEGFDLEPGGSYETDDPAILAVAGAHPLLQVEADVNEQTVTPETEAARIAESSDPHVNPHADHLSAVADPAVVEQAQKNAEAARLQAAGAAPEVVEAAVAEKNPAPRTPAPEQAKPASAPAAVPSVTSTPGQAQ